jgi:cysteine-rich repeat protein
MRRTLATTAVTLALAIGTAGGQGVIDQQTTCNDGGSAQIKHYEPLGQRFRPRAPNLVAVEVMLGRFNPPYGDTLTLRVVEDSVGGAFVAGVANAVSAGSTYAWHRFELPGPVLLVPGTPYVIELDATNTALGWVHQYELPPRCSYPQGEELVVGEPVSGLDASFRTYTLCGDGALDAGETCDDGNGIDTDGCTNACSRCGDRVVTAPEECDDGNLLDGDGCDANCTVTACGNGIVTPGETCDDGNLVSGDCCSSTCGRAPAGVACVDDGNECTDDVCDDDATCLHVANTGPCSDGNVCNGADTCSGGTCSVHVGNPCGSQPLCRRSCLQVGAFQYTCRLDAAGTPCAADDDACTTDACNGTGVCTHTQAPDGASCDDGDLCSTGDTCQAGACRPGGAVACDPCRTCDPASGECVAPSGLACAPATSGKSSILLRDGPNPRADRLVWRWHGLDRIDKSELGTPGKGTGFLLCVFDQSGDVKLSAQTGGNPCSGRACWRELPTGYRYLDPDGTPDGLLKLQARAGAPGEARLVVKGRGADLDMPPLGFSTPVTVQLRRSDGAGCWEAVYSTPTSSDPLQFKAKSD